MPLSAVEYVVDKFVLRAEWDHDVRKEIYNHVRKNLDDYVARERQKLREAIDAELNASSATFENTFAAESNVQRQRLLASESEYWRTNGFPAYPQLQFQYEPPVSMNWQYPYPELPPYTDAMLQDFRRELLEKFDSAFPAPQEARLREMLRNKYPLYRKGDKVTFQIRGGRGRNSADTVDGYIRNINQLKIFVGMKSIARTDLDPQTEAMFYADANKREIERELAVIRRSHHNARESFVNRWTPFLFREYMFAKGYVPQHYLELHEPKDATTIFWIPRADYAEKIYRKRQDEKDKLYNARYQAGCREYFGNAVKHGLYHENFEFYAPLKDYFPVSVAASLRAQLAAARREHQQALADARAEAERLKAEQLRLRAEAEARRFAELYGQEENIENFVQEVMRTMVLGKIDTMQWEHSSMAMRYMGINRYTIQAIEITGKEATCAVTVNALLQNGTNRDTNLIFTIVNKDNCFKIRTLVADDHSSTPF